MKETLSSAQGISLKNVVLTAQRNQKTISSRLGELLFTHYGISGPLVLSLSAEINRLPLSEITLTLDLKPALDYEQIDARLLREFEMRKNEQIKNVMRNLLPYGLVSIVLRSCGISPETRVHNGNLFKNVSSAHQKTSWFRGSSRNFGWCGIKTYPSQNDGK